MANVLWWTMVMLAGLTVPSFIFTLTLFARGSWHLGKRILATTAVLGFLLAVVLLLVVLPVR